MDLSLHGKNAIVCGSTQGIGKAIAIELAKSDATILLIARNGVDRINIYSSIRLKRYFSFNGMYKSTS